MLFFIYQVVNKKQEEPIMTLKQEKNRAKFLDSRLDDDTAAKVEKWNLALLGVTLLHDADHIMQAHRWNYHIPLQLWIINLAVYVMPVVSEFLIRNKRPSSFGAVTAGGLLTTLAFEKVHFWKPTTDVWGVWNNNYFKINKGVWHEGQFIQGITWYDWVLLLDLVALCIPMTYKMLKMRKEYKEQLEK